MSSKVLLAFGTAVAFMSIALPSAVAQGTGLPGDHGRPNDGIMPLNRAAPSRMQPPPAHPALPRAPTIGFAVKAAEAIATACKQYHLGVTVVDTGGEPILVYIPDGSDPSHGFMALRKAITAVTFKGPTSALVSKAQHDADFASKIKANPNLIAFSGGVLLKSDNEMIGAIGVSGAEPGGHDEECALKGLAKVQPDLH